MDKGASLLSKISSVIDTTFLRHSLSQQRCGFHVSSALFGRPAVPTVKLLPKIKKGGRNPDSGRVQNRREGGGHKQRYRVIDFSKDNPKDDKPVFERIICTLFDPNRTARIAVAASGNRKRYILASENMKAGDIVQSTGHIPDVPLRPVEGNSYAVGSLPVGTLVHNIEIHEREGGKIARAAGTSGVVMNRVGNRSIVKMPSKREMNISEECMVTVGRVSNIDHNQKPIGSASRSRWLGIRPRSGLYKKKTGYNGRKINPPKKQIVYNAKVTAPNQQIFRESS